VTDERRRRLALALMFFGAALRTWQYMARGSLWLDEAAIARNVVARSYAQLLQPLDYAQIAPKGFLLAEKLAVSTFGPSEHAFRLYAFVLSLLALPLFYRLARLVLSQRAALVALAFFAVLGRPIYYASEAKQYSGDIFFAIVLLLAAVPVARGRQGAGNAIVLGITGAIAVWFSQPAVFVLLGIALGIAYACIRGRARPDPSLFVALALCVASAIPALHVTMRSLRTGDAAYMRSFWDSGFMPWHAVGLSGFVRDVLAWPFTSLYGLFYDVLGMPVAILGVALAVLGATAFWRGERPELMTLLGVIGAALGAGMLHVFPFASTLDGFNKIAAGNGRVLLFLLPPLIILVVAGLDELLRSPRHDARIFGRVLVVVTLATPLYYAFAELPHTSHDMRPAIREFARRSRPGDRLFVFYGARQAFAFYRGRFQVPDSAIVLGGCHRPEWREYLREVDALRGKSRVWVLVAHPQVVNGVREGALIENYLEEVAPRLGKWGNKDAFVMLYDMRLVQPLRRNPASWHPPPRALAIDTVRLGFSCRGIFGG
jgi:hypothetical protein